MKKNNYELSVLVGSTKIREYGHKGRTYVEGRKGQTFTLQFKNNTACRVLIVPSIDGVSVVDGQPATKDSQGYIVPGYQSVSVRGWRTSLEESAKFVFADKPVSYSAQTMAEEVNCGVIGAVVFQEDHAYYLNEALKKVTRKTVVKEHHHHHYPPPTPWKPYDPWNDRPIVWCSTTTADSAVTATYAATTSGKVSSAIMKCAEPAVACRVDHGSLGVGDQSSVLRSMNMVNCASLSLDTSESPDFNLGTGYGETQRDEVTTAEFRRGCMDVTIEIFYTDAEGLNQIGIDVSKKVAVSKPLPQAFGGFCKPPKLQV